MNRQYLQKRGNTWLVVVEVPKPLRKRLGKPRFIKSLGTDSLTQANKLKLPYVSEWHRQIAVASDRREDPEAELRAAALVFQTAFLTRDRYRMAHGDQESSNEDELLGVIRDHANEILEEKGPEAAARYFNAATGKATFISDNYPLWLAQFDGTGQTKMQHETAVKRYIKWAGSTATIESTTRKVAGEYVNDLLATSGLTKRTIQRQASSLSSLWAWYASRGLASSEQNPWRGLGLAKKSKGQAPYRKAYDNALILKLLNADYGKRYARTLPDIVRFALLTGARIEALCALKRSNIEKRPDGYWLSIENDKTAAGTRVIPLHSAGTAIVERHMKGEGDYLFEGLEPGGPDKKRSWYVSKMFRYHRRKAGVTERGQDFHAFRNTFIACMEGHGVPESTVKLLVGHARQSMTFGLYSKGERVDLRAPIEKLDYGAEIMEAIRRNPSGD